MTSKNTTVDTALDDLLNRHFAGKVVRKDLTKLVKEGANVPFTFWNICLDRTAPPTMSQPSKTV